MKFRSVFPIVDFKNEFTFENCDSHKKFLTEIVRLHFESDDQRVKDAALAVYQAYRDHYPKYLTTLTTTEIEQLNTEISNSSGKIIKLRRIAINALAKVA